MQIRLNLPGNENGLLYFKQLRRYSIENMNLLRKYNNSINRNCLGSQTQHNGLPYWRNRLFATIMTYFLPLSLFALLPGIILALIGGLTLVAAYDSMALLFIAFITFNRALSISLRKTLFIGFLYTTSILLLFYLGSFGPGLLYLFGNTIFIILIFPRQIAYWSVGMNAVICILFGIAINFEFMENLIIAEYTTVSWIAVSSNLIILSIVIAALLPMLFNGLQDNVEEQQLLKNQLKSEQQSLKKTLEILKHKNIELEQFAYIASHDLQEPLRMVTSFLTLLEKKYENRLDDKAHLYIHHAVDGASRMRNVIMDLLEYSRAGNENFEYEKIDMNEMLQQIMELYSTNTMEKNTRIEWKNLPVIYMKKMPLFQVLQNLISNAIKYRKPGRSPVIQIKVVETPSNWQFSVSDNGIGINPVFYKKIFIVFQRLHNKEEYPGTGIGLAICNKIIENLGGHIWVESLPDIGSTFYFTIPKIYPI